jgi:hypothetical protein
MLFIRRDPDVSQIPHNTMLPLLFSRGQKILRNIIMSFTYAKTDRTEPSGFFLLLKKFNLSLQQSEDIPKTSKASEFIGPRKVMSGEIHVAVAYATRTLYCLQNGLWHGACSGQACRMHAFCYRAVVAAAQRGSGRGARVLLAAGAEVRW